MSSANPTATSPATESRGAGALAYSILSAAAVVLMVIQVFVAGGGLFTMAHQLDDNHAYTVSQWNNSAYWGIHFFNALLIAIVILAMVGTAFAAKLSSQTKRFSLILLGLLVLQGLLGFIEWPAPVAALHVLNAFAMLALAGTLARMNWAFGRRPM